MNRIKKLRKERSLTVAELAKQIGISQSMLSNYENGNSQPRDQQIWKKLAEVLNVDISYLMGFSNLRPIPMEEFHNLLTKPHAETDHVSVTIRGANNAFLNDDDIPIQDIYDELEKSKQDILYEVAQSLLASQFLSKSLSDDDEKEHEDEL